MKKILILLVVVVIVPLAWYLGSPLFIDEVVEEEFPVIPQQEIEAVKQKMVKKQEIEMLENLTQEEVDAMPEEEQQEMMKKMEEVGAKMEDKVMEEPLVEKVEEAAPTVVASGNFRDADSFHKGSGSATVYELPDSSQLLRFENFSVTNGPALSVYLVKGSDGDIGSGFLDLGKLKGNKGSQNYTIPAGTDLEQYGSVIIWCVPFKVLFAVAEL